MNDKKRFKRDCRQLGDMLLRVDGTERTFCSTIETWESEYTPDVDLCYFDTADETGESKYRIFFGITEI